jgi:hypothetical protein
LWPGVVLGSLIREDKAVTYYEGYSESKDTSLIKMQGIFLSSELTVLPLEIDTVTGQSSLMDVQY